VSGHLERLGQEGRFEVVVTVDDVARPKPDPEPYLAAHDVYQRVLYQPADRYWTFQWIEAAIFFALSGVLALLTLLLVRRRDA
jgi:hypothetical protein